MAARADLSQGDHCPERKCVRVWRRNGMLLRCGPLDFYRRSNPRGESDQHVKKKSKRPSLGPRLDEPRLVSFPACIHRTSRETGRYPSSANSRASTTAVLQIHARHRRNVHADDRTAQRRVGRRPRFRTALLQFLENVIRELAMAALNSVHADVDGQFDGRAQSPQCRHVGTADALKPLGANLYVIPSFGRDRIPQPIYDFVAHVQKARAFRRLQPLMRAG
jgi:hypothetical protein